MHAESPLLMQRWYRPSMCELQTHDHLRIPLSPGLGGHRGVVAESSATKLLLQGPL